MTNLPQDYQVRQQCLDSTQSFSVRAPAGSGKTELLTQRVLVLLSQVQQPEEVLCITFTRKAAAEMLDRLLESLRDAATKPQPEAGHKQQTWKLANAVLEQDKKQQWQLLENPNRLRIQTIDGLCARLTQSLPIESGFGAQPETVSEAYPMYVMAVERLLQCLEDNDEVADALAHLLSHLDNQVERLQELLIGMLMRRDQWLPWLGGGDDLSDAKAYLENALTCLLHEELQALKQQLQMFESELVTAVDYAASNLQEDTKLLALKSCQGITELPGSSSQDRTAWQGIKTLLLTDKNEWRKALNKNQGYPAGSSKEEKALAKERKQHFVELVSDLKLIPGLEDRLARTPLLPNDRYADRQWQLLQSLTYVLPNLVAHLLLSFKDLGAVDFTEVTQRALISLGSHEQPTDLALKLDYQIQHILIDEFQDTASPQINLLEKLTQGWQPDDGKTLFIVGDGMQSCYGFRDANVGLFLDARKHGIGSVQMTEADLQVNFRSQTAVVEWVNQTFVNAFPAEDDISRGAVRYEPSVAFNPSNDHSEISLNAYVGFDDRTAEAVKIRTIVEDSFRDYPQGNVAILVRNRTHLREILPELRHAGLSWQATDLDSLSSRMWVIDVVSLLKAWINPADRIAWLSALRAPWCGLSNADLLAIAGLDRQKAPIWSSIQNLPDSLSDDGRQRLSGFAAIMAAALDQRCRFPLRDEIEILWRALSGPELLSSESEYADIQRLLTLIDQHDEGGFIDSMSLFERNLANLYASPDSNADPRLQVMTIHKSKGLEFETVILAGLDRQARSNDKQLLMWQQRLNEQGEQDLLLSPISEIGSEEDELYKYLRDEQTRKETMEGTRLLYVGATRAIDRLHIVTHLGLNSTSGEPKAPNTSSLLSSIWPSIKDQYKYHFATISDTNDETVEPQRFIQRIKTPIVFDSIATDESLPDELQATYAVDNKQLSGKNRPVPTWNAASRHMGTLIHRLFRQLVINPSLYRDQDLSKFHSSWQQQLIQLGVSPVEASSQVNIIDKQLSSSLADEKAQWFFNPNHKQSACELPLSYMQDGKTINWVIDRTFVDEDDTRWIIDYKTTVSPTQTEFSDFIAAEVALYRSQLRSYQLAYTALEPHRNIKAALYFSDANHLEIVDL